MQHMSSSGDASSGDEFEPAPDRARRSPSLRLNDVTPAVRLNGVTPAVRLNDVTPAVLNRNIDSYSTAPRELRAEQVFYFSKKMFDFMCEKGTAERICQESIRMANQRKGDLLKRQEATLRTTNLREFVIEKDFQKPTGAELARLKRARNARKRNTDQIMGRSADQVKRRRYDTADQSDARNSDASLTEPDLSQQPESDCTSTQQKRGSVKRGRTLWAKHPVPSFHDMPNVQIDDTNKEDASRKCAVGALAKQLAIDFKFDGAEDFVPIDNAFRLPESNYETHGHFLSSCIMKCTLQKTGHAFVRAVIDHTKKAVTLKCKLSSKLSGRANQRKKVKEDDYALQAAAMQLDLKARENSLWQGKQRLSFTKRVCDCKCSLRLHYVEAFKEWRTTITCAFHNGHSEDVLPPPLELSTKVIDILQGLRSNINATVQQQLQLCAQHDLPVTANFIRRINASVAADVTRGHMSQHTNTGTHVTLTSVDPS
jgi:hypothetical protein